MRRGRSSPGLNGGVNLLLDGMSKSAVWERRTLVVLNYAALSFAIVMAIWGSRRIARRLEDCRGPMPFRELSSVAAPLMGAAATAVAFGITALVEDGVIAAVVRGATWLILGAALWAFLWTFVSLQLGLYRLGADPITEDARSIGRLGLGPLGDVAYTALWILLAWLDPPRPDRALRRRRPVGSNRRRRSGAVLATFFLSLERLQHRMVEAKREDARSPASCTRRRAGTGRPSLETLEQRATCSGPPPALEKRAKAIHDWPIDEGTFARVITIATSVVAITIGRVILDPFGL